MSRKHYRQLAQAIKDTTMRDTQPILNKDSFINIMCDMLYKDNNNFDKQRFIEACHDND